MSRSIAIDEMAGAIEKELIEYRELAADELKTAVKKAGKEESIEPGTETLSLKADAREDGLIKSRTGSDTVDKTYQDWYKSVYVPEVTAEAQG